MPQPLTSITVCRGRLAHLKQSLPRLVAQPGMSCIVVDYDCPDHSGDWVASQHPQVTVVRSGPRERFEVARARNLGAEVARSQWLCFLDADALVTAEFSASVLSFVRAGGFYTPQNDQGSLVGQCVVAADDFRRAGGYDEVLQGWGMEDKDLFFRLTLHGLEHRRFDPRLLEMIEHGDDMRVAHYDIKLRQLSSTLNLAYCRAKWDLMRLAGLDSLHDPALRGALYRQFTQEMQRGTRTGAPVQVKVNIASQTTFSGSTLTGSLLYELTPLPFRSS